MKNITDILKGYGIEIPEDVKAEFDKEFNSNYKTIAEVNQKTARITELEDQLNTAKAGLKAFEGVDVDSLKGQINDLTGKLTKAEADYQTKIADMEFGNRLDSAITGLKGKNSKAIKAMLDLDALKASKNQTEDIKTALENVKKENDYLFDAEEKPGSYASGTGSGGRSRSQVSRFGGADVTAFAKAAGLKVDD